MFTFTTAYIEFLDDEGLELFWPGIEPVSSNEYRNLSAIESALMAPFQTFHGKPLVRGIGKKGGRLFHSLIANHPFTNGNKRTAVLALDQFFTVNSYFLALGADSMHDLAVATANYRERGLSHEDMLSTIDAALKEYVVPFRELDDAMQVEAVRLRRTLRSMPDAYRRRM